MVNINQKDKTNMNLQDAIADRAERDRLEREGEVRKASQPEGGTGGVGGTGQARPHHGYDDPQGLKAMGEPENPDDILPMPQNGPSYQTGGSGLDAAQQVEARKQRESGVGKTRDQGPGMDPPPGAPSKGV